MNQQAEKREAEQEEKGRGSDRQKRKGIGSKGNKQRQKYKKKKEHSEGRARQFAGRSTKAKGTRPPERGESDEIAPRLNEHLKLRPFEIV